MPTFARRRGSTLAEVLFTLALAVTVTGAATLLYGHAVTGTLDSVALMETGQGTDGVARELDFYIRNSISAEVQTLGGREVLKLTMPAVKGTRDAEGRFSKYDSSFIHPRLGHAYEAGERVWIYAGTNTASIATQGSIPLLARRIDDATPALTDVDWLWTYRDGATKNVRRSPAVVDLTFSVSGDVVSWTISSIAARGSSGAVQSSDERTFRVSTVEGSTMIRQRKPQ